MQAHTARISLTLYTGCITCNAVKREIKTFEPEKDVSLMLERARNCGVKLGWLCNEALRRFLKSQGYSNPKKEEK